MYKVLNFIVLKYYFDFFLEKRQICFVTTKDAAIFAPALIKSTDSVAQLVEHNTFNVGVLGSSPSGITKNDEKPLFCKGFFFTNKTENFFPLRIIKFQICFGSNSVKKHTHSLPKKFQYAFTLST